MCIPNAQALQSQIYVYKKLLKWVVSLILFGCGFICFSPILIHEHISSFMLLSNVLCVCVCVFHCIREKCENSEFSVEESKPAIICLAVNSGDNGNRLSDNSYRVSLSRICLSFVSVLLVFHRFWFTNIFQVLCYCQMCVCVCACVRVCVCVCMCVFHCMREMCGHFEFKVEESKPAIICLAVNSRDNGNRLCQTTVTESVSLSRICLSWVMFWSSPSMMVVVTVCGSWGLAFRYPSLWTSPSVSAVVSVLGLPLLWTGPLFLNARWESRWPRPSVQFNSVQKTLIIPQGAILLWSWRARKIIIH